MQFQPRHCSEAHRSELMLLTVSDEVVPTIYQPSARQRFGHVDLVLGCGDLPPSYLEFIVSVLDVPCLYIPGNHDGEPEHTDYGRSLTYPEGCINIDGRVVQQSGLVLAGLGGSIWYNGGRHQYTQATMMARVMRLLPRILWHRRRNGYGLDVLVTHAPPWGVHDGSGAHTGFKALRWLLDHLPPRYLVHGHVHHNYRISAQTQTYYRNTLVINSSGYRVLAVERLALEQPKAYNHR